MGPDLLGLNAVCQVGWEAWGSRPTLCERVRLRWGEVVVVVSGGEYNYMYV